MSAPPRKVWAVPVLLCMLTMIGLLSALLGEAITWKWIAWLFLGIPILVAFWFACIRPLARRKEQPRMPRGS